MLTANTRAPPPPEKSQEKLVNKNLNQFLVHLNGLFRFQTDGDQGGLPSEFLTGNINKIIHNQNEA